MKEKKGRKGKNVFFSFKSPTDLLSTWKKCIIFCILAIQWSITTHTHKCPVGRALNNFPPLTCAGRQAKSFLSASFTSILASSSCTYRKPDSRCPFKTKTPVATVHYTQTSRYLRNPVWQWAPSTQAGLSADSQSLPGVGVEEGFDSNTSAISQHLTEQNPYHHYYKIPSYQNRTTSVCVHN